MDGDMEIGYNDGSPAICQASQRGDGLWEIGTVGIIGILGGTVKARRRQKSSKYSFVTRFYAPITYGRTYLHQHL